MASSTSNQLRVPYENPITDSSFKITTAWQQFFRLLKSLTDPLGYEQSFQLVNNQAAPADITGLSVDSSQVSQAIVEYLIQRVTTSTGATELVETGIFMMSYQPKTDQWRITAISTGLPDNSGVAFMVNPQPFFATYDHTTALWTKASHGLINGTSITISTTGSVPSGYSPGTTYYVINASTSTFKLSATLGGSAVVAATNNGTGAQAIGPQHAADGQVQYTTTNETGTASISKIAFKIRTLGGKNLLYSSAGSR